MSQDWGPLALQRMSTMPRYNGWIYERIAPYAGQRILEVGCGIGNLTHFLINRELVIGIDIDSNHIKYVKDIFKTKANMQFILTDINKVSINEFKKYKFDTIVCLNVLEHIKNDMKALGIFYELLSPGGRLLLQVPALPRLFSSLDSSISHFRRYSKKSLLVKTNVAGLQTEHCSYMNIFGILVWFWNGKIMQKNIVPEEQLKGSDVFVPLLKLLDKPFNNIAGLSIIYSGIKK